MGETMSDVQTLNRPVREMSCLRFDNSYVTDKKKREKIEG